MLQCTCNSVDQNSGRKWKRLIKHPILTIARLRVALVYIKSRLSKSSEGAGLVVSECYKFFEIKDGWL